MLITELCRTIDSSNINLGFVSEVFLVLTFGSGYPRSENSLNLESNNKSTT